MKDIGAPYVRGNILYHGNGERLIIKGMNLECGRSDKDDGLYHTWFNNEYDNRVNIAELLDTSGFNAVRLNCGVAAYAAQPDHFIQLEALVELYASRGMYSMPSVHDWTGAEPDVNRIIEFFNTVIDNARAAGYEKWLILNPWNEGGSYSQPAWINNCESFLDWARTARSFEGPVVFDQTSWATEWHADSADQVIAYDSRLRGGLPANVLIGQHWYPWTNPGCYAKSDYCTGYPLVCGELGRYVDPNLDTQFALDLIDHMVACDIPNGYNGIFLWMLHWCDAGSLTDEDVDGSATALNSQWGAPVVKRMTMAATRG